MSRIGNLFAKFRPDQRVSQDRNDSVRWLIAGLGNPGEQYRRSRHNTGFRVVERLARRNQIDLERRKFDGFYGEIHYEQQSALIVMPQTFYNRSGECVASMLGYFKIPAERLVVVHDEMDLPAGQLRIKTGGSDAGNRGVRSIIESLGTQDFVRMRIGVGHPEHSGSIDYLLRPLTDDEAKAFDEIYDRAADAIVAIMRDGVIRAMNFYNQRV
jgi:peptidyl-tRNA hydrolase, PTH1 family